ncbi:MAG TPA: hypothetical protein VK636_11180 [Gemmatimonadaceae bacterium]|nr:hypothetical protein [Gemmatimonadaceae bacterium]
MSVTERSERSKQQEYGAIIVVGGGCYGSYYVRQLQRAARAGALNAQQLIVVDQDPTCAVATSITSSDATDAGPIPVRVDVAEWRAFFNEYLERAADAPQDYERDAIVPSPLMPHLMAEWVVARARTRWPNRVVETQPIGTQLPVPWQRSGADATHYVSFADWICPVNCIEPRTCPVTKGPRDWSLPPTVRAHAERTGAGAAIMHCRHRTYGVGMFDTAEVIEADGIVQRRGEIGATEVLVGTTSHCHGALTRLVIGPLDR